MKQTRVQTSVALLYYEQEKKGMDFLKRFKIEIILLILIFGSVAIFAFIFFGNNLNPNGVEKTPLTTLIGQVPSKPTGALAVTDEQIASLQEKLRAKSDDSPNLAKLGLAYLQKVRETGDPVYYIKTEETLNKALQINPNNVEAMGAMGALSLSRHQFAKGLEWGQKAMIAQPQVAYNYGVVGDALVELGRYDEAVKAVQQMVNTTPNVSSYSRVSYIRELYGKTDEAIEAMKLAYQAGGPTLENRAWVCYQLGNLYFNRNDLPTAEALYQQASTMIPNYVYAQAGLAKIASARGDLEGAIKSYADITKRMPLPEFVIEYGDLYTMAGKADLAKSQYDLVRAIGQIYKQSGVNNDVEMALFNADHDYQLTESLASAKEQMKLYPSIKTADVLAWTLYKTSDYKAAQEASQQALRLGTQDSSMFFHAAMIANKLGQTNEARTYLEKALRLNPNFSFLHATEARKMLAQLSAASK